MLDGVMGDGFAAISPHGLFEAVVIVAPERGIDTAATLLGAAPGPGEIGAMQRAGAAVVGELGGEPLVGGT